MEQVDREILQFESQKLLHRIQEYCSFSQSNDLIHGPLHFYFGHRSGAATKLALVISELLLKTPSTSITIYSPSLRQAHLIVEAVHQNCTPCFDSDSGVEYVSRNKTGFALKVDNNERRLQCLAAKDQNISLRKGDLVICYSSIAIYKDFLDKMTRLSLENHKVRVVNWDWIPYEYTSTDTSSAS